MFLINVSRSHTPFGQRHYYEVMPAGAPCRLYFDLEYKESLNENVDSEQLVSTFKSLITRELEREYGLVVSLEDDVVDLRSASLGKFSCHLIWDIPGVAFADNLEAGNFVAGCLDRFRTILADPTDPRRPILSKLLVRVGEDRTDFFVDEGVYTKNRALRIYLSSKHGAHAVFLEAGNEANKIPLRHVMERSLVTYFPPNTTLDLLTAPTVRPRVTSTTSFTEMSGDLPSDLDAFILSVAAATGVRGTIRSKQRSSDGRLVRYHMANSRFCGNVNRHHKSNNIYYDVRLDQGVFFQRCTDSECKGYVSPPRLVPYELIPQNTKQEGNEDEFIWEDDGPSDEILLAALMAAEQTQGANN